MTIYHLTPSTLSEESAGLLEVEIKRALVIPSSHEVLGHAISHMCIAGLAVTRIKHAYGDGPSKTTSKSKLVGTDDGWIEWLLTNLSDHSLKALGWHILETVLEDGTQRFADKYPLAVQTVESGMSESVLSRITKERSEHPTSSPHELRALQEQATSLFVKFACHENATRFERHRIFGICVLLESAEIQFKAGFTPTNAYGRKLAEENAIMRALGMAGHAIDNLREINAFWDVIGSLARLDNAISDALDRVEKYIRHIEKDPDGIEAGLAAGRPYMNDISSLRTSIRQCRLFRDREKSLKARP